MTQRFLLQEINADILLLMSMGCAFFENVSFGYLDKKYILVNNVSV